MIKIDLITGFLGSGKTTFIKHYAQHLMDHGYQVGILENDLGAVNVDMMLLQELRGDSCELEMVSACCGNDPETHRRRLKSKLISMGMSGYDRVVMEPSGIFDMDEFFDILHDEPLDRWYEIGSVLAIVDARLEEPLSVEADYILATEAADAGCVVLSRCQDASETEIRRTMEHLNRAMEQVGCGRRFSLDASPVPEPAGSENRKENYISGRESTGSVQEVLCKDWASLTAGDFEFLMNCGFRSESYVKQDYEEHGNFESLFFMNTCLTEVVPEQALRQMAERILADDACGKVFRIKGFVRNGDDGWLELNAARQEIRISPISDGQEVLIVVGEHLNREAIEKNLHADDTGIVCRTGSGCCAGK